MWLKELWRELGQFPFEKLKPPSFRLEIASLPSRELESKTVRIWVKTDNVIKIIKLTGQAKILRVYPHLDYVLLETYAKELAALNDNDLVRSVWNDGATISGVSFAFGETNQRAPTLENGSVRVQGSSGRCRNGH